MACGAVFSLVANPTILSSNVTAAMAQHAFSATASLAITAISRSATEGRIHYISVNLACQMYLCSPCFKYGKFSICPKSRIAVLRRSHHLASAAEGINV